jgi:hypothetical protein
MSCRIPQRINFWRYASKASGVAYFLTLECFLQRSGCHNEVAFLKGRSMDPKIALLFLLIGSVIGLSYLSDENLGRVRRQLAARRWREFMPGRRKA